MPSRWWIGPPHAGPALPEKEESRSIFPERIDSPGIVMICVDAKAIRYWDDSDEGQIAV
jgi:hypothetical protein